jgi:FAM72 protein
MRQSQQQPRYFDSNDTEETPTSHIQSNLTSRLLDLAVSASFPREEQATVRHSEIPRQMTRAMSQLSRLNAARSSQQRMSMSAANPLAVYADSLMAQQRSRRSGASASVHPSFRSKSVCCLHCKYCEQSICDRGMKAILLADTRVLAL